MKTAAEILREYGLPPPPNGEDRYYTTCPKCSATRSRAHQKAECLGITIDDEGVKFGCNHCGWTGGGYFKSNGKGNGRAHARPQAIVVAEFPYRDESGNALFVVERRELKNADGALVTEDGKAKKEIKQKRPDPDRPGKWLWNVKGVRVVPYACPS